MSVFNISSMIISILSLLVSIISAIYQWIKSKDKITVKWHTKAFHLSVPSILLDNYTTIPPAFTKLKNPRKGHAGSLIYDPYLAQITIINYGENDIGYFGLKVTDQDSHSYPILTKNLINKTYGMKYVLRMAKNLKTHKYCSQWRAIHIPDNTFGILKAHSYHVWNVVISGNHKHISSLRFQIGLTEKHWYNSTKSKSFKGKIKIYNTHLIINDISNPYTYEFKKKTNKA